VNVDVVLAYDTKAFGNAEAFEVAPPIAGPAGPVAPVAPVAPFSPVAPVAPLREEVTSDSLAEHALAIRIAPVFLFAHTVLFAAAETPLTAITPAPRIIPTETSNTDFLI